MNEHKKMNRFLALILFIVTLPFVILGLVFFGIIYLITTVIPSPVEMIIYKKSSFYKDLNIKYSMGITTNFGYKTYKYVKENKNMKIIFQDEGYYYYKSKDSVLVMPYYAEYKYREGEWYLTMKEGGEEISAHDIKPTFQTLIKEDISSLDVKLLVKEKCFKKQDLSKARNFEGFVFYKSHKDFNVVG